MESERFIHSIESEMSGFERCWDTLVQLRSEIGEDFAENFIRFQERLSTGLEALCRLRGELSRERKKLLRVPGSKRPSGEVEKLEGQIAKADAAAKVGFSLGDSFVYFFYQNERKLLQKHLSHPKNGPRSDTLGHLFEYNIARSVKLIDGEFAVHHCLTTMLRLGDVTVFDLKNRKVVAIGELKTIKREGDSVTGIGRFIFKARGRPAPKFVKAENIELPKLPAEAEQRFARQVKKIGEVFKNHPKYFQVPKASVNTPTYGLELTEMLRNRAPDAYAASNVSDGLVISVIPLLGSTFCERMDIAKLKENLVAFDQVVPLIAKAVDKASGPENAIVVNSLSPSVEGGSLVTVGFLPLFWRNIDVKSLKPLFFYQAMCMTFFNPIFLKKRLIRFGLTPVDQTSPRHMNFEGKYGEVRYRVEGFYFLCELVSEHLFKEESVMKFVKLMRKKAVAIARKNNVAVRMNADFVQAP